MGGFWGRLGGILEQVLGDFASGGDFGAILGPSWAPFGPVLDLSWGPLGAVVSLSWAILGDLKRSESEIGDSVKS